jgi:hypothetical protein
LIARKSQRIVIANALITPIKIGPKLAASRQFHVKPG